MPLNFEPRRLFPAGLIVDDLQTRMIKIDKIWALALTPAETRAYIFKLKVV
ncbi:hypothetical protein [Rhizobium leguminosarum]|uniref:hypothetical protein n=1 Tax=Rhizobium leguminosarum TaxID=384 RepID=UPI001AE7FFA9|nr:hypothetical protein [Rhizobium leguminosarum]MBP2446153.1 hypothetical protein [Rhizobium leguminosarum]